MSGAESTQKPQKPTILVVEDHDALRDSLKKWLSSIFQDCSVLQARSGEEALDALSDHPPDVLLMDVMLPGMNGIETVRKIKRSLPDVSVVMLSIYEDPAYKADAADAGVDAYVSKRKMGTELIPVITKLLYGQGFRNAGLST